MATKGMKTLATGTSHHQTTAGLRASSDDGRRDWRGLDAARPSMRSLSERPMPTTANPTPASQPRTKGTRSEPVPAVQRSRLTRMLIDVAIRTAEDADGPGQGDGDEAPGPGGRRRWPPVDRACLGAGRVGLVEPDPGSAGSGVAGSGGVWLFVIARPRSGSGRHRSLLGT